MNQSTVGTTVGTSCLKYSEYSEKNAIFSVFRAEISGSYPKPPPGGGFADILRRCGLDPKVYTFHSWRHTCASRLSESGASVEMLRRFGGWTSDRMAEHYDHAERLDEMRAAMERTRNYTECSRT